MYGLRVARFGVSWSYFVVAEDLSRLSAANGAGDALGPFERRRD